MLSFSVQSHTRYFLNQFPICLAVAFSVVVSSCKTTSEVQREQQIDLQIQQSQQLLASLSDRHRALEEQLLSSQGSIEEKLHQQDQDQQNQWQQLLQDMELVREQQQKSSEEIDALKEQTQKQQAFIEEVLKKLEDLLKKDISPQKSSRDLKTPIALLARGHDAYEKNQYKTAISFYEELLEKNHYQGATKARIYHNLGQSYYAASQDKNCQFYLSKLYTDFSKSSLTPSALLTLAKSLKRTGQNDRAVQTLRVIVKNYSTSNTVKESKTLIKKWK